MPKQRHLIGQVKTTSHECTGSHIEYFQKNSLKIKKNALFCLHITFFLLLWKILVNTLTDTASLQLQPMLHGIFALQNQYVTMVIFLMLKWFSPYITYFIFWMVILYCIIMMAVIYWNVYIDFRNVWREHAVGSVICCWNDIK